jgi:hypothetical protein
MKTNFILAAAAGAFLIAGCTEKALDAPKAAKPTPAPAPVAAPAVPAQPFTNFQVAAGPNTAHTIGSYDAATRTISAEKSQAGALVFGPYTPLPAGKYRVTYLVTAESDADGVEVGRVDVNAAMPGRPGDMVAQLPLKSARGEQSIPLTFDATGAGNLYEFRVWSNGKGNRVSFKTILVEKI